MTLAGLAVATALASGATWQELPSPAERWRDVTGVRSGRLAVFVGGEQRRVGALAFDFRTQAWTRLRDAPLRRREGQLTIAAGRRVIVLDGRRGAVLDPVGDRWRRMPRAPLPARHTAVWTGRELIVPEGAAYDPARNRWRRIRPAPLRSRTAAFGAGRLIAIARRRAAAYDPGSDRWRAIAPSPIRVLDTPRAVWSGSRMLVFSGARGATYDPRRDRWRLMGRPPIPHRNDFTAVWDGRRLLIWGGVKRNCGSCFLADGAAFRLDRRRWRRLPPAPLAARHLHAAVPVSGGMLVWAGSGGTFERPRRFGDGAILHTRSGY